MMSLLVLLESYFGFHRLCHSGRDALLHSDHSQIIFFTRFKSSLFLPKSQKCCTKIPRGKKPNILKMTFSFKLRASDYSSPPLQSDQTCQTAHLTYAPVPLVSSHWPGEWIPRYQRTGCCNRNEQSWSQFPSAGLRSINLQQNLKANALDFTGICPYPKQPLLNVEL